MAVTELDTIVAIATPPGRGGVGILRFSGPQLKYFINRIVGKELTPRFAHYNAFRNTKGEIIDYGLSLFFPKPNSYTGEDILELHGHGGTVVMDSLLQAALALGARLARPGEFTERAFLNGKLDLTQAEAVADLIDSASTQAARSALKSLEGTFSNEIQHLCQQIIELRMYVEAAIDFPEEEIDFLSRGKVSTRLADIIKQVQRVQASAQQGVILQEGMTVVIAGRPNAGKSSLLNSMSGRDSAIVTEVPGTTRDILRECIQIDGMPLHILDTAGIRDSDDIVEQEGVKRAWQAIARADRILFVADASNDNYQQTLNHWLEQLQQRDLADKLTVIHNKIDKINEDDRHEIINNHQHLWLSAKTNQGIARLKQHLKDIMGYENLPQGVFMARRRHLMALEEAEEYLLVGARQLEEYGAAELLAEDLRRSHQALGAITGEYRADDLLGEIFSSFCIGK